MMLESIHSRLSESFKVPIDGEICHHIRSLVSKQAQIYSI